MININGTLITKYPLIMGILNLTPDSFFDGGKYNDIEKIIPQVGKMIKDGANIIDVGGYSSRPNAKNITIQEEIRRVLPILEIIKSEFSNTIISLDTFRSEVLKECIKYVDIANDISSGEIDNKIIDIVSENNLPYISMHMMGTPQNMQQNCNYKDVTQEVILYFSKKIKEFYNKGLKDIIIDPGFGFSKTLEQNYELLNKLELFKILELPILVGISRKSMIYKKLNISPEESLNGTTILNTIAISKGADILRVHDVKQAREIINLYYNNF